MTQGPTGSAAYAAFRFRLTHVDARCAARSGTLATPHGSVQTPAFMPVGTQATVKAMTPDALRATGAEVILANTYHLTLRPGEQVVNRLGGLHRFMGWSGPILTDSGGFQLYSLASMRSVTDQGATFRSHIDGRLLQLTPERAVEIQEALGADIIMVLDDVVGLPAPRQRIEEAVARTIAWAARSKSAVRRGDQALFAIVQGGLEADLRVECAGRLAEIDFPGYAIGGLGVGEEHGDMYRMLEVTVPALPAERPRYLMGVGRPQDLLEGIRRGIDLFDCVMPTRNGRNALAFTDAGKLRLRNKQYEYDDRPLEEGCPCPACQFSRGYLRHLFLAKEMLGPMLLSAHNLTYYQRLMAAARRAIEADRFVDFSAQKLAAWSGDEPPQRR